MINIKEIFIRILTEDEEIFKKSFKGSTLEPHYQTVKSASEKYGVPYNLAAGIMAHETGYGKNVKYNNPAGLMDPKTKMQKKMRFDTPEAGIDAAVRTIGKNYERGGRTIEGMAKRYAPVGAANDPGGLNKHWPSSVQKLSDKFSSSTPSVSSRDRTSAEKTIGDKIPDVEFKRTGPTEPQKVNIQSTNTPKIPTGEPPEGSNQYKNAEKLTYESFQKNIFNSYTAGY